jgi:Predicted metal-dependent enzyme
MSVKPTSYGGQAVIEGVMIRGRHTIALACRKPDGGIYRYREALDSPLVTSKIARAPFVRGVVVLWESLRYGMRMLMRSADVQLAAEDRRSSGGSSASMLVGLAVAVVLFIGIPYVATGFLRALIPSTLWLNIAEGVFRLALLLGYLVAISFLPDIRRVFAYHGAEHMTIHAFEHGDPLDARHVAPYPTAHPRCGTAFLLFVVVIAIAVFAFVPRVGLVVDLVVRLVLVIPVAAISYEVLRLGAGHEDNPVMRLAVAPGLLLQAITTRRPDDPMIEVAIASLEEALAGDATA